ncbi:hypothetical protein GCM10009540_64960 [Streptomyces turgidiscabies]
MTTVWNVMQNHTPTVITPLSSSNSALTAAMRRAVPERRGAAPRLSALTGVFRGTPVVRTVVRVRCIRVPRRPGCLLRLPPTLRGAPVRLFILFSSPLTRTTAVCFPLSAASE